jgi:hypothetical protein
MRSNVILLILLLGLVLPLGAQGEEEPETRVYDTKRISGEPPVIDGRLDDAVWSGVEWSGDFIQRDPADGKPPSQRTRFKVVYDDDALYFAFRLYDEQGRASRILARRDNFPGDWIEVNIDSYRDHRTAFSFTLSLSGTRGDEFISNDGDNWDTNWDPVWNGATQADAEGWTAETRIPLSQLRFSGEAEQTWGLQVQRRVFRLEERSTWQRIPKNLSGWVSRFGELRGLRDLEPKRHVELLPYAVASTERSEASAGDPFSDGSDHDIDGGLDGKIGVSNNLTLDFTVNPDFGQVEADPSRVNLTEFETFFDEQRPFFVEGQNIFDLRLAPAITGGPFERDTLFYSRRIGRRPAYGPSGDFVDSPENTTILGAFKLSGKTRDGLSVGMLESVAARERARVEDGGEFSRQTVEPLTNYFVGRLQQDWREGEVQVGGMITAVNRRIAEPQLEFLPEQAYAGGIDFGAFFLNRDYRIQANLLGSTLRGSQESITRAQRSPARFYQRPNNDSATFDPTRTSLGGHSGSVRLSRTSNHELMFQTGVAWRSPGFEINDLGFMRNADQVNQFTWIGYTKRQPFSIFDRWQLNFNEWLDWDFGGNFLGARANVNTNAQFRNKYNASAGITWSDEYTSNTRLRGGPSSLWPGSVDYNVTMSSDQRKKVYFDLGGYISVGADNSSDYREVWGSLTVRPINPLRLSLSPSYSHNLPEMQYVGTRGLGKSPRYLFGRMDQKTVVLNLRVDYSITPNLTVQLYASPFVSNGRFSELKRITDPLAERYRDRFRVFDDPQIAYDPATDLFDIDENVDGTVDYAIGNPDFDVREFNSNLVVRWEYRPGSTLFVVWSQARDNFDPGGQRLDYGDDLDRLFSAHPTNVFLVKLSKWFAP